MRVPKEDVGIDFLIGFTSRWKMSRPHRKALSSVAPKSWWWTPRPEPRQRLWIGCPVDRNASEKANQDNVAYLFAAVSRHPLNLACRFTMLSPLCQREKAGQALTGRGVCTYAVRYQRPRSDRAAWSRQFAAERMT